MEYRKFGDAYYIKMERDDEIVSKIIELCKNEGIKSATYSGIGGCRDAEIQTFIPEEGRFETRRIEGMLELVSFTGNVMCDDGGKLFHHTHATFAYRENGEHKLAGGHLKSTTVLYIAELELRPVIGGVIRKADDPETGTGFWSFSDN